MTNTRLTDEQMLDAIKSACNFGDAGMERWRAEALIVGRAVERALLSASKPAVPAVPIYPQGVMGIPPYSPPGSGSVTVEPGISWNAAPQPDADAGSEWAPNRIWLQRGVGDEGSHTWCEHSVGTDSIGDEIEEVEYVRAAASAQAPGQAVAYTPDQLATLYVALGHFKSSGSVKCADSIMSIIKMNRGDE